MPDTLASFRGPVSCRRGAAPLGLTLSGETSEHPGERTELAFSAAAPADFPEALEGAVIERVGTRSEEHTSELQSLAYLVCRLRLEKKNNTHVDSIST